MSETEPWRHPISLARRLKDECFALFYSGMQAEYSGRYSLLACNAETTIEGRSLAELKPLLSSHLPRFENAWFGMIGYETEGGPDKPPSLPPSIISLPPLQMTRFSTIYRFDHLTQTLSRFGPEAKLAAPREKAAPRVASLESNMSRETYLMGVSAIREAIHAGDVYQVNLTRKFFGTLSESGDTLSLFQRLCEASPAPYSAYMKLGNAVVISSSPEQFLTLDPHGALSSRPIKGSAPPEKEKALGISAKDRAENLMIVDLMRHDFSRVCMPGSVRAPSLHDVQSFATVAHMTSTVTGQLKHGAGALDAVSACFPPGSMTGAPKPAAINLAARLEGMSRGVYSGALGWFGGDGGMDLSVVIRTLIVKGNRFEFQVGGGIVADSEPEAEWRETLIKAEGIRRALGGAEGWLESI